MKVPVYQKQTAPAVPAVAQGNVARPAAENFAQNQYTRLAQWSDTLRNLPGAVDNFADKFLRALVPNGGLSGTQKKPSREADTLSRAVQSAQESARQKARQDEQAVQENATVALAALVQEPQELKALLAERTQSMPPERRAAVCLQAQQANVSAALMQGEEPQAAAMLQAFGSAWPQAARQGALKRLTVQAADKAAQTLYKNALEAGENPSAWQAQEAQKRVAEFTQHLPEVVRQQAQSAWQGVVQKQKAAAARAQAGQLDTLIKAVSGGDEKSARGALFSLAQTASQEADTFSRAAQAALGAEQTQSRADVFNALYRQAARAPLESKKIARAFEAGQISGRDYLLLARRQAQNAGGAEQAAQRLVCGAAQRLCRKNGLDQQEAEDFQYALFSQDLTPAAQAQMLKKMKEFYFM